MHEDVLVAGDTLVDFHPNEPGSIEEIESYRPKLGGSGANVAIALDRLGFPPSFWTRLGGDGFADMLAERLAETRIPDEFRVRDPEAKTTLAFVANDPDGERRFEFYRTDTADTRMAVGTVPDGRLDDCDWVHLTGVTLSVEPSRRATMDLARRASKRGCTVSLDPNARPEMWTSRTEFEHVIRDACQYVDVVKASREDLEPAGFDHDDPRELAAAVTEYGPHTAFITLGSAGSLVYGTDESPFPGTTRHGGYTVDAVDATGAGDGFLAATIASMASGGTDPERVLATGNAAGAVMTTRKGSVDAIDGPDAVRSLAGELAWDR